VKIICPSCQAEIELENGRKTQCKCGAVFAYAEQLPKKTNEDIEGCKSVFINMGKLIAVLFLIVFLLSIFGVFK